MIEKKITSQEEKHPKQDFQVERLAFFSDAVFAIAITLLIIEFKIPHVTKESTYDEVWKELVGLKFKLFSLFLSFMLIVRYWIRHHFLFKHIHNYNGRIIIANMYVLLPIIFFPFTTAFFAESIENPEVVFLGLRLFLLNHILANIAIYFLYWLALIKHNEFSFIMEPVEKIKFNLHTIIPTSFFVLAILVSFFTKDLVIIFIIILAALFLQRFLEIYLIKKISNKNRPLEILKNK